MAESRDVDMFPEGHPQRLPAWRKGALLGTASFGAFLANYCAAAHLTAFPQVAQSLQITIPQVASAVGIGILGLGFGPLLWGPLASSIGRRPTWLFAWFLFFLTTIWISLSPTYANFEASRFLAGFTSSVSQSVPGAQIADVFHPNVRGLAVAVWTFAIVTGPITAPLITAAILTSTDYWRWIYWLVVILVGFTLLVIYFFIPETLVVEQEKVETQEKASQKEIVEDRDGLENEKEEKGDQDMEIDSSSIRDVTLGPRRVRCGVAWYPWKHPLRFLLQIFQPFRMALYLPVLVPSIIYAVFFGWSVGQTIITPQVFMEPPWRFTNVEIGASFMSAFVGAAIGKIFGGWFSDLVVTWATKRKVNGDLTREPEPRMWALLAGLPFLFLGAFFYGYGIERKLAWPVAIIVGTGGYYVGVNATQSVVQTYVVECYLSKAAYSMALFNLFKCVFAFGVTYYIPEWSAENYLVSYGVCAGIALGLGLLMAAWLLIGGKATRRWQGMCA